MLYRSDQSRTITRLAFSLNQSFGDLSPANFGAISLYKSYSLISGIVKFLVARSSYPFSFDSNGRINYLSGTNVIMNRLALSLTGTNPFLVFRLIFPRAIRSGPICLCLRKVKQSGFTLDQHRDQHLSVNFFGECDVDFPLSTVLPVAVSKYCELVSA